jgi:hypothetical protein
MAWPSSIRLEEVTQGHQTLAFDRGRDGESHRIMLEDSECEIVLRHEDVDRRSQQILDRYRVPADRSPDLMAVRSSRDTGATTSASTGPSSSEPSATSTSATSE